jgi:hypothetical protein
MHARIAKAVEISVAVKHQMEDGARYGSSSAGGQNDAAPQH